MATIYQQNNRYSDNNDYQNFLNHEHSSVCHSKPEKVHPKIFHQLALVLEEGGSYLDQHTRHAINFVLKHHDKIQEYQDNILNNRRHEPTCSSLAFSPTYCNSFMGLNLKTECQNHLDRLNRDLMGRASQSEVADLKKNLINLLHQIYQTL